MANKSDMYSRKKLIFFSVIPSVVVLLLVIVISEVGLRMKFRNTESITGIAGWKEVIDGVYTYYDHIYHPMRGWTNRPGYQNYQNNEYNLNKVLISFRPET
jgi:hypothetical protein